HGVYDLERSNVVAAQDIPLHASGDYSPSVKRFYSRHQDSHSPLKHFDPHSDFPSTELSNFLPVIFSSATNFYKYYPALCLHQLQALNAPRAPPLV
ncbi:MAG: hypothetical protein AAGC78_16760, partial [Cellvibrio sp.]|uniref:hypothetical protein n=1 Tax=Cellvibrio sp. TaxID=1965322 RepID=UPI00319FC13E